MTGTADRVITMEDMNAASINRKNRGVYVPVDTSLEVYLLSIMGKMMATKDSTDLFAILHTVIEIAIQAGIDSERKQVHSAVADADIAVVE